MDHPDLTELLTSLFPLVCRMVGGRDAPGRTKDDVVQEVMCRALERAREGYFDMPARTSRRAQAIDLLKRLVPHALDPRVRRDVLSRYPAPLEEELVGAIEATCEAGFAAGFDPEPLLQPLPPRAALYARLLLAPRTLQPAHLRHAGGVGQRPVKAVVDEARAGRFDLEPDATWAEHVARVAAALFEQPDDHHREAVRRTLRKHLVRREA